MAAKGSKRGEDPDPKGLYATLGVAVNADEGEIRKAYRRLALRWHPDKNQGDASATAEFQKISAAYEVLSDAERREMYDSTGCIDAEELEESEFDHAQNIFAAFFSGCTEDLEPDEQAMLDEFLRLTGGSSFRMKGRGKKKGRGFKTKPSREQQILGEAFMAAMAGQVGMTMRFEPECAKGHPLKRRKADEVYECDVCSSDIPEGKRFFDCRKCDFSMCQKCEKEAEEKAIAEQEEVGQLEEVFETFCDMHLHPVRKGRKLQFQCDICEKMLPTQQAAAEHMAEEHEEELKAMVEELQEEGGMEGIPFMPGMPGMGMPGMGMPGMGMPGMGMGMPGMPSGFEAFLMAGMGMEDMMGGGPPRAGPKGARRPRKKR